MIGYTFPTKARMLLVLRKMMFHPKSWNLYVKNWEQKNYTSLFYKCGWSKYSFFV